MLPATARRPVCSLVLLLCLNGTLSACASGPSTREDVCAKFDALGESIAKANGIFDNAVFRNAGALGGLAGRYPEVDLSRDASRLKSISKSDQTNGVELMAATSTIADVCGHPLATNALFGG